MAHYHDIGGFLVPIESVKDANALLASQGYGINMFSIPVGPAGTSAGDVTQYACKQPFDPPTFRAVRRVAKQYQGKWIARKQWQDDTPPQVTRDFRGLLADNDLEIKG